MLECKLFNFNHAFSVPREFEVGPFRIYVAQTHIDNLKRMKSYDDITLSLIQQDNQAQRVMTKKDEIMGDSVETALLRVPDDRVTMARLYNDTTKRTSVDDLCLILSFLTGRRVYLEDELIDGHSKEYKTRPVGLLIISDIQGAWNKIDEIVTANLMAPFYNLVFATQCSEYHALVSFTSSVLNALYEDWHSRINAAAVFEKAFKQKFLKEAKTVLIPLLNTVSIPDNFKSDIDIRFDGAILNILTPSAVFKIKQLLVGSGLYPEKDDVSVNKRVQWLNWVRNAVAHRGDLPLDRGKGLDLEMLESISASVAVITLSICQFYFSKVILNIQQDNLGSLREELVDYFSTGTFRDMKVFEETYEEYMARLEDSWINDGELL